MKAWKLKCIAFCLMWFIAWPASAAEPVLSVRAIPAAVSGGRLVVLDREEFVKVLSLVDYLQQDKVNRDQQITLLTQQNAAILAQAHALQEQITAVQAQLDDERKKAVILQEDRDRLAKEVERADFWSTVKNYAVIGLGAAVLVLIL